MCFWPTQTLTTSEESDRVWRKKEWSAGKTRGGQQDGLSERGRMHGGRESHPLLKRRDFMGGRVILSNFPRPESSCFPQLKSQPKKFLLKNFRFPGIFMKKELSWIITEVFQISCLLVALVICGDLNFLLLQIYKTIRPPHLFPENVVSTYEVG